MSIKDTKKPVDKTESKEGIAAGDQNGQHLSFVIGKIVKFNHNKNLILIQSKDVTNKDEKRITLECKSDLPKPDHVYKIGDYVKVYYGPVSQSSSTPNSIYIWSYEQQIYKVD